MVGMVALAVIVMMRIRNTNTAYPYSRDKGAMQLTMIDTLFVVQKGIVVMLIWDS